MKINTHLLLEKANEFPRFVGDLRPKGCFYDMKIGAWVLINTGGLLADTTDRDRPTTKKNDVETGEDLKSE